MSQRLHASRPAPHLAGKRPIDRKFSNPAHALGGLLMALLVILWVAVIYALVWIASVPA